MIKVPLNEQMDLIRRGVEEIIPEEKLVKKIEISILKDKPLTIKLGCDPSRPDLHIGHGVVLRKLRHFQDLGHTAVLIIGDFTAMIGDPSGRNKTRPQLSLKEARENAKSYVEQSKVILDINNLKIKYNSDWLNNMNFSDVVKLASLYTVSRMLERDDFTKRFRDEIPISVHEFLYPLAQAQDSVELKADVELGGTDQKFNLLLARDIQKNNGLEPQCIITTPLLEGTDGKEKMSKTYGNDIALRDSPQDMYGKTLSISDDMIIKWFKLAADYDIQDIEKIKSSLKDKNTNPMSFKRKLAKSIVSIYYDQIASENAEEYFDQIVVGKGIPDDIETYIIKNEDLIVNIIFESGMLKSKGQARRMIKQGAVKVNNKKILDFNKTISPGDNVVLKVGKRRFLKVN